MATYDRAYRARVGHEYRDWVPQTAEVFGVVVLDKEDSEEDKPVIYLPHQCEEWHVGTAEDARAMAADLIKAAEAYDGLHQ